jgi:GNAT superfamily N-acetyltransferase
MAVFPCFSGDNIIAKSHHVPLAVAALSGHMNLPNRIAFHDKLHRYAVKSHRDLFLARENRVYVGFSLVIENLDPPEDLSSEQKAFLRGLACGTGLRVRTAWRGRGIGRSLVAQWEFWAKDRNLPGIWCVTHRMGDWYRDCLGYRILGSTHTKGVVKTVMIKTFGQTEEV